ncbi:MAG: M1 family aminopeptidase, partial [Planctomycetota bacterium]
MERIGQELARTYDFYTDTFGPLEGDEIHIGVSSAGQGGHGGYLSFTMDTNMLGRQITEETLPMVMEPMRHELAHSWWGWSVTSYGPGTKFLRESLANFASSYFVERTTGQDRVAADMAKLFWLGLHTDLICGDQGDSERAAYMKGPAVLNVLRGEMGEPQFLKVLKHFASEYRGSHATMSNFVSTCGQVTGEDWKEFFDQWCFGTGVPDYRIERFDSTQRGEKWQTEVVIRNAGGATITCPLELRMANDNDRRSFRVEPGQEKTLTFTTPSRVTEAVIDPEHRTYQGSGRECRLKMLGVGEVQ